MTNEEKLRKWVLENLIEEKKDEWWALQDGYGHKPDYLNHNPTNIMVSYFTKNNYGCKRPYIIVGFVSNRGVGNGYKIWDDDGKIEKLFRQMQEFTELKWEDHIAKMIVDHLEKCEAEKNATLTQR